MHELISVLHNSKLFTSIEIIELVDEESVKLIKLKARVIDDTLLYITELHTSDYQRYSYHWQKKDDELIMRWDNKPHWRKISTFPHHKHIKDQVLPSHRVTLDEVMEIIKMKIS